MADTTITGLPNASTPLSGTERVAMDQGLTTVDATTADIAATLPEATISAAGKMSAADKTKLNGITGTNTGDKAIASTSDATSHTVTLSASGGSLRLVEGANITLTTSGTPEAAVVTVASTASGGSGATNLSYTVATRVLASDTGTDATLPLVTTDDAGLAPASGGGTANFLRADGTWAATGDVTLTGTQTLTNKTFGNYTETVFTITDAEAFEINPNNGPIQLITLGANRTPAATTFAAGQSVMLMIADGTAFAITWTTVGVVWVGGTAPTLATTGLTVIELWKVSSTIYGALVGTVA